MIYDGVLAKILGIDMALMEQALGRQLGKKAKAVTLNAAALKAGMHDLDGLKLADISKVKLNDAGEIEGADKLMEDLKKAKPYLFGAESTSSAHKTPNAGENKPKTAMEMTSEEYRAARQKVGRRGR